MSQSSVQQAGADISIVVPCHNEEACLDELYRRMLSVCTQQELRYELILVDDGSHDATWRKICELHASDDRVLGLQLSRNFGHEAAIIAGLDASSGELICVIDGDLQDPPELLPAMLEAIEAGSDVAYARRRRRDGEGVFKRFTAWLFYRILGTLSDVSVPANTGNFRLLRRAVADQVVKLRTGPLYFRGRVAWVGFRQVAVDFDRQRRHGGDSNWPTGRMIRLACDAIVYHSMRPLEYVFALSIVFILITVGAMLCGYMIAIPSFATMLTTCLLVGMAMMLVSLGVLSLYVSRLLPALYRRPVYVVRERVRRSGFESGAAEREERQARGDRRQESHRGVSFGPRVHNISK